MVMGNSNSGTPSSQETSTQGDTTMENDTNSTEIETTDALAMDAEETATEDGMTAEAASEDKTPAWVDFTAALDAHASALGLQVQDQAGFTKYINAETGHKLYIAKQGRKVKRIDTTLPILGQDGTYDLSKPNGKIACHLLPDLEVVTAALTQLADSSVGKIRAAKRVKAAPAVEAVEEAPAAE
jgi:hypothetical protein